MSNPGGDHITASFTGTNAGQFAVGKDISQRNRVEGAEPMADADWGELQKLVEDLRAQVTAVAPAEQRASALERVDELEDALVNEEPDLTTVHAIKKWFVRRLPAAAGLVTGVLVNPVVGKLVQTAGDAAMSELAKATAE